LPESKTVFKTINKKSKHLATSMVLLLIKYYRLFISPLKPQVCRFYPSCSQYTYEAVRKYGIINGSIMGVRRILNCHPFNPGGYHPVE